MSKLLPCPFCASPLVRQGIATPGAVIYCQVCFAQGPATPTVDGIRAYQEAAAMGWNKAPRTAPTLAARLDEAVGLLRRATQLFQHGDVLECGSCGRDVNECAAMPVVACERPYDSDFCAAREARAFLAAIDAQGTESAGGTR